MVASVSATPVDDFDELFRSRATVNATVHILAANPYITFGPDIYPSLTIQDVEGGERTARIDVSFTGTAEQRQAAAATLREIADRLAAWAPVIGPEAAS